MSDDPPPGPVEVLDEWDDDTTPRAPVRRTSWLIGGGALVTAALVIAAVVHGSTKPLTLDPVPTPYVPTVTLSSSVSPTGTATPGTTHTIPATGGITVSLGGSSGIVIVPVSMDPAAAGSPGDQAIPPDPIPSGLEAEPLLISLVDAVPVTTTAMIRFRVKVCVSPRSAAINGAKVEVARASWSLEGMAAVLSPMTEGGQAVFPDSVKLGRGECVTGYVSFARTGDPFQFLNFADGRTTWRWRVS